MRSTLVVASTLAEAREFASSLTLPPDSLVIGVGSPTYRTFEKVLIKGPIRMDGNTWEWFMRDGIVHAEEIRWF